MVSFIIHVYTSYDHLHWMIVVNIILNHIKTLFMWCVLANCVTVSVRTSGTVSCQPLPFVSSAHWSGRSCSGDDIDLRPPNHQSPHLCSRREGCVYTCTSWQILYEVCSWVPRLVNCSVHAHTWVSVTCSCSYMICVMYAHTCARMHARTHTHTMATLLKVHCCCCCYWRQWRHQQHISMDRYSAHSNSKLNIQTDSCW